ncbi:MAG: hypothetical protein AB9856_06410 [Cellulosilyticaceae bacterium]
MTQKERELIRQLIRKSVSKEYFLENFTVNVSDDSDYIKQLLEIAYDEKEAYDIDYLLYIGFTFKLFTEEYIEILCKLIESMWHEQHENIAGIFQFLKSPQSIESLYKTVITQFEYLDYDESYALAVKCIWALGNISTSESKKKLQLLSESDNEIISENAIKQLERRN